MRCDSAKDQRQRWRRTVEARRSRQLRPTLLALEHRSLLSTFAVNNPTDTPVIGELDLRQAIGLANAAGGANTIDFESRVFNTPQTITLSGTQLELSTANEAVTIRGPAAGVTISGGGLSRVFQIDDLVTASFSGLTISDGNASYAPGAGGGVFNLGTLTLTRCTVSGNSAGTLNFGSFGGGVANGSYSDAADATLTMTDCSLSDNNAYSGGGLYNDGKATLTNCTVSGNSTFGTFGDGGGVYTGSLENGGGTTTLTNCTISGNRANGAFGFGGGVANYDTTTLTNCTVSGNSATAEGGGLFNSKIFEGQAGALTLIHSTVSGNSASGPGGGLLTYAGTTTLTNSTVSGNTAGGVGGGVSGAGSAGMTATVTLTDCTVSGNSGASFGGGGVGSYDFCTTALTNCTVSGNSSSTNGGGIWNAYDATTTLTRCTVSGNSAVNGGGIFNNVSTLNGEGGTLHVTSSGIVDNQATYEGGGMSTIGGNVTITGSLIAHNRVNSSGMALGGGIYSADTLLSLTGCTVDSNQANGTNSYGGGIYALDSTVDMEDSTVNFNQANGSVTGEGGGIYAFDTALTLVGTSVKHNKATTAYNDLFDGP